MKMSQSYGWKISSMQEEEFELQEEELELKEEVIDLEKEVVELQEEHQPGGSDSFYTNYL